MPWGTEFPTRVRAHRTAWSTELAALPGPPHREVWTSPGAQANAPALTASAELLTPTVKSGVVANLPASGDSFPHQFPWQFKGPDATMSAKAELLTPTVGVGPVPVDAPVLAASAELLAPEVSVTTEDVIVEAPLLTASADMPAADLVAVVEAPLLTASAAKNTFPYRFPRSFAPNGFLPPQLVAGADLPTSEASADLLPPTVSVGYTPAAPVATASAEVLTPSVSSGAAATVPVATASAELPTPSVIWTQPPVPVSYTTGSYALDVAALRSQGYTHIIRVVWGAGGGGAGSTFLANAEGGDAGTVVWDVLALASYPSLTALTGSVGTGGTAGGWGGSGGTGGNSTSVGNAGSGVPTLTGTGGSGGSGTGTTSGDAVSSGNANGGKDVTVGGQTFAGGGTASAGSNGNAPGGGGGAASSSFSAGRVGGRGQVDYYVYRDA